jgi:uncharacterized protein (UPF0332 family)
MFEWRDYLRIAEQLITGAAKDEAALRAAVSRAYYAAFNVAKARLFAQNRMTALQVRNVHMAVWQHYSSSPDARELRIGQAGYRLRNARNSADYDADFPNVSRDAAMLVQQARNLIDSIAMLELVSE